MKAIVVGILCTLAAPLLAAQATPHHPLGIVSDWANRHVLYPDSKNQTVMKRIRSDPRWLQNWYLRHGEAWWTKSHPNGSAHSRRDWSVPLGTAYFEPVVDSTLPLPSVPRQASAAST